MTAPVLDPVDLLVFEAPLVDSRGRQTGWMSSILDITDRKRAEVLAVTAAVHLWRRNALLSMAAGWVLLAGLGVSYVISGDYAGWHFGLAQGGWGGLAVAAALGAVVEQAGAVLAAAHDLPGTGGGGRSGEVVPPVRLVRARRRGLQGRRIGERPHLRRRGEVRAPPEARAQHRARHPVAEATVDRVLRRLEHGQRAPLLVAGPAQVVAHDGGEHPAPPVVGVHPDPRQPLRGTKGGPLASRSRHGDLDVPGPGGARRLSPAGGDEARSLRGVAQLCLARSARAVGPDEGVELEQGLDLALVGRVDAGDRDVARHEVTLAPGRRARQRLFVSSPTAPVRREATR